MDIFELKEICGGMVLKDEPMSRHTSFRLGGPADFFALPEDEAHLCALIKYLSREGVRYYIIGKGSNLLVSDEGYRGVIICFSKDEHSGFSFIRSRERTGDFTEVEAGAGCPLSEIGSYAATIGATGFEPLSGIPGSMGGATVMNAGAYGKEMKDVISRVEACDKSGRLKSFGCDELDFRYRGSDLMDQGLIVTKVCIHLKKGDPVSIEAGNKDYMQKRKEKQPLEYPSAGSTFKRPEGHFAGQLISEAGLKGYTIGGARVSEKHAGFLINFSDAKAMDVYRLIKYCQKRVFENSGVMLEPEVRLIGDFC